jgi:23S rRNA-/tRNA-specific pseudouridylate synthase
VLYQDEDFIIINKPYGLTVQGGKEDQKCLAEALEGTPDFVIPPISIGCSNVV